MKNIFKDRKTLYVTLGIVMICVFTLTIAYAALNAVLEITGSAEVSAADWDIRLENPIITSGSVNSNLPVISGNKEASFSATLSNPGDFYEFSIDVVNNGSIDAMIDGVTKTPTLTETQAKYLNYIVEYQNGEAINTKQLVSKNSFVRLKVRVEFRKDLTASDLPSTSETLNLSFTVNYVQADEVGTSNVPDNGVEKKLINVVKGDGTQKSDEVCIGEECFYVISSTDEEVKMLAKYNLHVGNTYGGSTATPLVNPTGIQDETAIGWFSGYNATNPLIGTKPFSSTAYWSSTTSTYPAYVYNENSYLYEYVENYKAYLISLGVTPNEARLITIEELEGLGCVRSSNSCSGSPEWVYSTSYWSGSADYADLVWSVDSIGNFDRNRYYSARSFGVRPVIVIERSLLN